MTDELETREQTESATPLGPSRSARICGADVYQAADALLVEGHKPTIDRVRMRIGRGSPNTIQEYLEEWWTKLGARLRDIPGREFPELPDRVALALQKLWNEAVDCAHASLGEQISTREQSLTLRETALDARERSFIEQEQAAGAGAEAREEHLVLALEQLHAANLRADRLELSLQAREADTAHLRERNGTWEVEVRQLRSALDRSVATHQAERVKLDERHAASESRWLVELDRTRLSARNTAKELERLHKEMRAQISLLKTERADLKTLLQKARGELRAKNAECAKLEKRLLSATTTKTQLARPTADRSAQRHMSKPDFGRRRL